MINQRLGYILLAMSLLLNAIMISIMFANNISTVIEHGESSQDDTVEAIDYDVYDYKSNIAYEINNKIFPFDSGDVNLIFLGDSITSYGEWENWYSDYSVLNRGIGSDVTEGVLNRVDEIIGHDPNYIFIMIGINDIGKGIQADDTVENMRKILERLTNELPECIIVVFSIIPSSSIAQEDILSINENFNDLTEEYDSVTFVDMYDEFSGGIKNGEELFTNDGTHLTYKGYKLWMTYINQVLENRER